MSTPQQFKNRKAAHEYLVALGHDIPYRTFGDHCKANKCQVEADKKTILLGSLMDYIKNHLGPVAGNTEVAMSKQKLQQEIDINAEKLKKMQVANRKEDSSWMLVADHDQQVAALMGVVFDIVTRELDVCMDDIMMVAGVESSRRSEISTVIKERIDAAKLTLSTSPEFEVVFGEVEDEEAA